MSEKPKNGERRVATVINQSIIRALTRMEDEADRPVHRFRAGEINGWKADALASYIVPAVVRAVKRALLTVPKPKAK